MNKYSYPVKLTKNIVMTYDESPVHNGKLKHAVDFICKEGTKVFAAEEGIVIEVKSDFDKGGNDLKYWDDGNYIEIKHDDDEYSIYEHLKKNGTIVKIGDRVKRGKVIGYSGATGYLAHLGPHLHFDVHKYVKGSMTNYKTIKIIWLKN